VTLQITVAAFAQLPFYLFLALTYASGRQSEMPVTFIVVGGVLAAVRILCLTDGAAI